MTNVKKYDLEERTAKFGEAIIEFCKKLPRGPFTDPLIIQLIKSATSVGANYCEADCAEQEKILSIKSVYVKKNLKKQSIG